MSEQNTAVFLRHAAGAGALDADIFEYRQIPLAPLETDHIRLRITHGSIDAGTRAMLDPASGYVVTLPPGEIVPMSAALGVVSETRHPGYRIGQTVRVFMVKRQKFVDLDPEASWGTEIVDPGIDPLTYLGTLGLTGFTAWIGMLRIARPLPGETVLVSSAGGAVGSVAGQLAKAAGARVVGLAGGAAKCARIVSEFGFDHCIDYRAADCADRLMAVSPEGFDIFFDNVGGPLRRMALDLMREEGRIALCGQISQYEGGDDDGGVDLMPAITKRLRIEGFRSLFHRGELAEFTRAAKHLVETGRLHGTYTVTPGLERLHEAINSLTSGANLGQQIHAMD